MTIAAVRRSIAARAGVLALAMAAMCAAPRPALAESLADAIALAYQTNPTLLAARADLRALDERYIQARAALGPTASVSEQHSFEAASVDQQASIFGPGGTSYLQGTTDSAQLTINQPLYSGGQLSAQLAATQAQVFGGRESLRQQEQAVLNQVITAYADVVLAQQMATIARQDVEILRLQVAETKAKVDVRENTLTDSAQAHARLIAAQLKLIQARAGVSDAAARYLAAVGQSPGPLDPLPDLPGLPPDVDAAFDAADRSNPQLRGAVDAELASRAAVAEARAADGLQVSLSASLATQPEYPYVSNLTARAATAAVIVSKPLFTAGAHQSRLRQALETNNRDILRLAAEQRQIVVTVAQAWSDLIARREQIAGLGDQLTDEEQAFHGSQIEERIGLRTTIDVLNAEQEFQATKVALAQAYHDEYLNRTSLLAAMGLLQAELIEPDIHPYRPEQSLDRRNGMTRALPWEALVAKLNSLGSPHVAAVPSDREPLPAERPAETSTMPSAPNWSDLGRYLKEGPAGG